MKFNITTTNETGYNVMTTNMSRFKLMFGNIDHETDPETGQTRLFQGGIFRSDGVFINSGSWDS